MTSVGYAALSTSFLVSGEAKLRVPADIRITDVKKVSFTNEGYDTYNSEYYKDGVKLFTTLPNLSSSVTYQVEVTNNSDLDYYLEKINNITYSNNNVKYVIGGINIESIVDGNTKITFDITVSYVDTVEVLPSDNLSVFDIEFIFKLYDTIPPTVEYSLEGGTYNSDKAIIITPIDNVSGIDYYHIHIYKNGEILEKFENLKTGSHTVTLEEEGTYEICTYAEDRAGNRLEQEPIKDGNWYYQTYIIDKTKPTLTISNSTGTYDTSGSVTLTVQDEGGSGLSDDNKYQYCLSTSNESATGCTWTTYTSGSGFTINGTDQNKYLWVYPVSDKAGNINGDYKDVTVPYIIGTYKFISTYTISYDLGGGTVTGNPTSYNIETETFTLKNPTRTGYTFTGWSGSNGTTLQMNVTIEKGSTGNKSYKANWKANTYTITYDTNIKFEEYALIQGFTVTEVIDKDASTGLSDNYYKASFNKTSGTVSTWNWIRFPNYSYELGATYRIRINVRLQSVNNVVANIRHAAISNDFGTAGRQQATITDGPIGEWKEYTLTRTFDSDTVIQNSTSYETNPLIEIITNDLALTGAVTSRGMVFDYKDVYVGKITTSILTYGNTLGPLVTPTREGYTFDGWYTEPVGGTKVASSTSVPAADTTYYAHWNLACTDKPVYTYTGTHEFIDDGNGNWRIKFKSSGDFTLTKPLCSTQIDVFLVGGGGGGVFAGGGGGYTETINGITISNTATRGITVGKGGTAGVVGTPAGDGGNSGAFGYRALGGKGANNSAGGDGGSGGAAGGTYNSGTVGGNGGSNGSNGTKGSMGTIGIGQFQTKGTNTREFGEEKGALYSGGGAGYGKSGSGTAGAGGGGAIGASGGANTGGGGGGGDGGGSPGGSGIVVIRNAR